MYACLVELPKNKSPQPLSAIDCLKEISIWKLLDVQKRIHLDIWKCWIFHPAMLRVLEGRERPVWYCLVLIYLGTLPLQMICSSRDNPLNSSLNLIWKLYSTCL